MPGTTTPVGSAARWGPLWGARASDWALNEAAQVPLYADVLQRVGPVSGQRVLEVGCGSGYFLRLAADHGAEVVGLDASEALLGLARERVPEAELHTGDLQFLPFDDASFDVVAGFNAFFFAADMVAALREAGRVARPGAPVAIQVWGRPEQCDLTTMKDALRSLAPPPDSDAPQPPGLWEPGVLESMAEAVGLRSGVAFDVRTPLEFPDEETMLRGLLAPGVVVELVSGVGERVVRDAFRAALAPFRAAGGSYRFENEWHVLVAFA